MKLFKHRKKDPSKVNTTIADTSFIKDLTGVSAIGFFESEDYFNFKRNFPLTAEKQIKKFNVDYLNGDLMDPTIDSCAYQQKMHNQKQHIIHNYTNQNIVNQADKYKKMNKIYAEFIDDVIGGLNNE